MNYRHDYHAGNFADVFKHAILSLLLHALHGKEKGFCYVDAYAGAGSYDLQCSEARRTGEYLEGIARLWLPAKGPAELAPLLGIVRKLNPRGELRYYPGSPRIAEHFLRPQDRMVLLETQTDACRALERRYREQGRVQVRGEDAWAGLRALLPPIERRGLVLIDPPYEQPGEFALVSAGLADAVKRWPTGMYAIWYPVKDRPPVARFHRDLQALGLRKIFFAELLLYPGETPHWLNGCGMAVINPPWTLPEQLARLLPALAARLSQKQPAQWRAEWLVGE